MYIVNKNINYGGKVYAKDCEIGASDPGFKELLAAGHLNEGKGTVASAPPAPPVQEPEVSEDTIFEPAPEDAPKAKKRR